VHGRPEQFKPPNPKAPAKSATIPPPFESEFDDFLAGDFSREDSCALLSSIFGELMISQIRGPGSQLWAEYLNTLPFLLLLFFILRECAKI
jgi:hypothetical protein